MTDRIDDSVYEEPTGSLALAKKLSSAVLTGSQNARDLALQLVATEFQHHVAVDQDDSEPLIGEHFRQQDKLVKKAVDDFHLQLVACD